MGEHVDADDAPGVLHVDTTVDLNVHAFGREGDVQTVEEAPVLEPSQVDERSSVANCSKTSAAQRKRAPVGMV